MHRTISPRVVTTPWPIDAMDAREYDSLEHGSLSEPDRISRLTVMSDTIGSIIVVAG